MESEYRCCSKIYYRVYKTNGEKIKKSDPFRSLFFCSFSKAEMIIVPDVEQFPGHIACSSLSKSEIVLPLIYLKNVVGVLDVDSAELNSFDNVDAKYLQQIIDLINYSTD